MNLKLATNNFCYYHYNLLFENPMDLENYQYIIKVFKLAYILKILSCYVLNY